MANRLADYKFTDFQGQILDSPDRIANFLAEFGQKYAAEFPGKNPFDNGFGPQKQRAVTNSVGGLVPTQATRLADDPRWENPAQMLALNFFGNPETAKLINNPDAVRAVAKDPAVSKLLQDSINGQAADMRSRDSGNIFTKAIKNIGTFATVATGLAGGLGALSGIISGTGAVAGATSTLSNIGAGLANSFLGASNPIAAAGQVAAAGGRAAAPAAGGLTTAQGAGTVGVAGAGAGGVGQASLAAMLGPQNLAGAASAGLLPAGAGAITTAAGAGQGGRSIIGGIVDTAKAAANSPVGQVARAASTANSIYDLAKSALGVGVPVAAGIALANGLQSAAPSATSANNLGGAADVKGSVPDSVGDPRLAERKRAEAASGASDTIATSALGLPGAARVKRKQVLGG